MGKKITVYLTDEEVRKMRELCDAYGEDNQSRIIKIAISELHVDCDTLRSHRPIGQNRIIHIGGIYEKKRILKKEAEK